MASVHLLQLLCVVGAALCFAAGLLLGRLRSPPQLPDEALAAPAARRPAGPSHAEADTFRLASEHLQAELAAERAQHREAREKVLALQELLQRAEAEPLSSDAGAAPRVDEIADLHRAVTELQQQLADKQTQLRSAHEQRRALSELLEQRIGQPESAEPGSATATAPSEADARREAAQLSQMHAALEHLEAELATTHTRATEAEDKLRAVADLWTQQQAAPAATGPDSTKRLRSAEEAQRRAERQLTSLQQGVESLEQRLRETRTREQEAQEKIRALEELLQARSESAGPASAMDRKLNAEQRARRDAELQVTQLHAAVTQLEELAARRATELREAKEKLAALDELLRSRSA